MFRIIFNLKVITTCKVRSGHNYYTTFIDFIKAYDPVDRESMIETLK